MSVDRATAQAVNAFVDGELELTKQLEFEALLGRDESLRDAVEQLRGLRDAVRSSADIHAAPDALRARLLARPALQPVATAAVTVRVSGAGWRQWFAWRPIGVGIIATGLLVWALSLTFWQPGREERLMQEVIASHVRSTLGQRLVDVASSDQHTVKPALAAKLDFSPPVADVPVPGVGLVGGRVDYLDGRLVAALVYRQRQHVIDAYVWPSGQADEAMRTLSQHGFNIVHWARSGMRFWVVSDLNRDELSRFAQALAQADANR